MLHRNIATNRPIDLSIIAPYYVYIKNNVPIGKLDVPLIAQRRFTGDFYGLLHYMQVLPNQFDITLMLNSLADPSEYVGAESILVLAGTALDTLINANKTVTRLG